MTEYTITWAIQIDADDPVAAAEQARVFQRDLESEATVFEVEHDLGHGRLESVTVDLTARTIDGEPIGPVCALCGHALELVGDPAHPYAWKDEDGSTSCPDFYADCGACQDGESHPHAPETAECA